MKVLILSGDGINCEKETARAFALAGGEAAIIHSNDLLQRPERLLEFGALAFPGGFSYGDDLGSGQVLALKLKLQLGEVLRKFYEAERPIIGICNGFQALTKLGLLPEPFGARSVGLAKNSSGQFLNRWIDLEVEQASVCLWTKGIQQLSLPIRHGEGRIAFLSGEEENIHRSLAQSGQIVLRYREDVNGSYGRIAGICDPTGRVLGLMPHPEAAVSQLQHPQSSRLVNRLAEGPGLAIFKNCIAYMREKGLA